MVTASSVGFSMYSGHYLEALQWRTTIKRCPCGHIEECSMVEQSQAKEDGKLMIVAMA